MSSVLKTALYCFAAYGSGDYARLGVAQGCKLSAYYVTVRPNEKNNDYNQEGDQAHAGQSARVVLKELKEIFHLCFAGDPILQVGEG